MVSVLPLGHGYYTLFPLTVSTWLSPSVAPPDPTWAMLTGYLLCACHIFPTGQHLHLCFFHDPSPKTGQTRPSLSSCIFLGTEVSDFHLVL